MNFYKEKLKLEAELEERKDKMKDTADCILDIYNKYPKECSRLLKELSSLNDELEDLEKELDLLVKEYDL